MEKTPLVSVTMPVYNGERTIQLAIDSLFHQTYPNWKCIIVNDCSTDGTGEILKKYESDARFKIIYLPENKGRGNARQVALDNAEGDYMAFLDADDFYHPEKLDLQVKAFIDNPKIVLCSTGVGSFDNNYKLRTYRGFSENSYGINYQSKLYSGFPASCMMRLNAAKNNSYNLLLDVGEDNDFIYKILFGKDYYILNKILYYYEEIGVISFSKFVMYQIKYINALKITSSGSQLLFLLSKEILKLIVKCVGGLFLGVDYFILKRGRNASDYEISAFNRILSNLKVK
jgi:glycosyltransferase involved in cell wall biosynthesis